MIDFDALVLKPAGDIFQIKVVFTPTVSQPAALPIATFGVFSSSAIDVIMQDDTIYSDQQTKLDIRLKDFAAYPMEGDTVTVTQPGHFAYGRQYWIGDISFDGQGGANLLLRVKNPTDVVNPYPVTR